MRWNGGGVYTEGTLGELRDMLIKLIDIYGEDAEYQLTGCYASVGYIFGATYNKKGDDFTNPNTVEIHTDLCSG
jgi:hypothetical protein